MIRLDDRISTLDDRCLHYRIGGFNVSVRSELDEVLQDLDSLYHGYPQWNADADDAIYMEVRRAVRSRLGRSRYVIVGDGEEIGKERHREEVIPFLEWGVNWRVISAHRAYLQIHAATLSYRGRGCIFAGSSGCGKSTLAAGLVSRGWHYLCDELGLIDPRSLKVHPFPKALCIKSGAFETVRRVGLQLVGRQYYLKGSKGRVAYVNPMAAGEHAVGTPSSVRFVALLHYTPGASPRIRPISRARAAFALARHALNRDRFREQAVSVIGRLVRGAECVVLESGALDETCKLLEEAVLRTPDSP